MHKIYPTLTAILIIICAVFAGARDLSKFAPQNLFSEEEIQNRKKLMEIESQKMIHIDTDDSGWVDYDEWKAQQGPILPFSTRLVNRSTALRADSKICVIVNGDLYPSVATSITQHMTDLVTEGYEVEVHTVTGGIPQDLRGLLQTLYADGMDGGLFVGDLPIAWYEESCDWQVRDNEQFPCDYYYMDLDGDFYDDDSDGLFDRHEGNQDPEIYFGRLLASPLTYGGANEADLINNYFAKNHTYRTGGLPTNTNALVFIDDDWAPDAPYLSEYMKSFYCQAPFINDLTATYSGNYEKELTIGHEFVHLAAHSTYAAHYFTSSLENGLTGYNEIVDMDPPCLFYSLFACSNSRYVNPNYMGGWYIFTNTYGLAVTGTTKTGSMLNYDLYYNPIGSGATLGEAYFLWWDYMVNWGIGNFEICWFYGNTFLGDPTLRPSVRRPIELVDVDIPYCLTDRNYSAPLDADGGGGPPYYWTVIGGALPDGLTLDLYDGIISGRPTESGIFNFTVEAEDICPIFPPDNQPIYADTMEYSIGIVGLCGDANNSGLIDMDDVNDIIDYLFSGGSNMCPVAGGDADKFIGTNINDAYYLYSHVAYGSVFPKCPPFLDEIPSAPQNILEIRNCYVQPGNDKYRLDFWLNATAPGVAMVIPFEYSCATSPVTCDSISFAGSHYSHYAHKYGIIDDTEPKALIGLAYTGETKPTVNTTKIASVWFSIESSTEEQLISINSASCGPNACLIVSPSPTTPYIPSIALIPGLSFMCGDADNNETVDILDIVYLINYKYKSGPAPVIPESSNVNGDTTIDILDIVFLINYKYKSGPAPSCE